MSRVERVLILAAHPDDEALGCGGAIAHHADRGDSVDVIFLADGVGSREGDEVDIQRKGDRRREVACVAARILGAQQPHFADFPDQMLDQVALLHLVKFVERVARDLTPTLVYTHHRGDLNTDHRAVADVALTAFRPTPNGTVKAIYGFEVLSSTEWRFGGASEAFLPTHFLDISKKWSRKTEALRAYREEVRAFPHPRSFEALEALARVRGATVGVEIAEAFIVYWEMVSCQP